MPILGIHHVPSLNQARYEQVVRRLTGGQSRVESQSDAGIEGLLVHVARQGEDGFWVVDVWESQEAVDRFSELVGPIAQEVGIEEPMATLPVHVRFGLSPSMLRPAPSCSIRSASTCSRNPSRWTRVQVGIESAPRRSAARPSPSA